ncbi:AAA domain-containing protein [Rhodococcus sp. IEGM 1351]|uniref:DEAD/DEAH box helicase n=1 Tax=Rhodococcus sp. IEGM 1351 TaxID=3047089 RepID=UPI0024B6BE75|nr:AAA domain-containing protein [Rhodococcus sp. IEGM 1351]MDI9941515.1 AAA domain-containing protein [Rhodococcus sp. IEGM 1351]
MKFESLAHSDERAISLLPLGDVTLKSGTLVSVDVTPTGVIVRRESEALLCEPPRLHDVDWLADVTASGAYVAELLSTGDPTQLAPAAVNLKVLRYDGVEHWSEPREVGVDDRTVADVNRYRRRNDSSENVVAWLKAQLTLDSNDEVTVVATGAGEFNETGFRVVGSGIVADICLEDGRLFVARVTQTPRNRNRRLIVVRGRIDIKDHTRVGLVSTEDREELKRLSSAENAFLAIWNEYSRLEQKAAKESAEDIGWAEYDRYQILGDGTIEFDLVQNSQTSTLLERIGSDTVGLEASLTRSFLEDSSGHTNTSSQHRSKDDRGFVIGDARTTGRATLVLVPEREIRRGDIPAKGEIYGVYTTDSIRIGRREKAQQEISLARTAPARQLSLILAGKRPDPVGRIQRHEPLSARARALLGGEPTPAQVEAIDLAINSQDVVLIQGPPGTGKTRVIAAIQARLAELSKGHLASNKRVLFASYQHDAVENLIQAADDGALPPVKIGARHRGTEDDAYLHAWAADLQQRLEHRYQGEKPSELLHTLRQLRERLIAYRTQPFDVPGTVDLLVWLAASTQLTDSTVSGTARRLARKVERELGGGGSTAGHRKVEVLARSLRALPASFEDDGRERARDAALNTEVRQLLDDRQRSMLDEAATAADPHTASARMAIVKSVLLDRVMNARAASSIVATRPEVEALLKRAIDSTEKEVRRSTSDIDLAVEDYRDAVAHQPGAVRKSLQMHSRALAATCQQSASGAMRETHRGFFDTVILDEAARANPLDLMIPMSLAMNRIILVGDHRQLPQLLDESLLPQLSARHDTNVVEDTLRQSMFQRLFTTLQQLERTDGNKRVITLDRQFRTHPTLGRFISDQFYKPFGECLENGINQPGSFAHGLAKYGNAACGWIDVPFMAGPEQRAGTSISRPAEAQIVVEELGDALRQSEELTFGVITFYSGQVDQIWQRMSDAGLAVKNNQNQWVINPASPWLYTSRGLPRVRIGTVDAFQGREFDVVYLSTTRSSKQGSRRSNPFGFLVLPNRLNVAMSRQKRLLIVVGDAGHMTSDKGSEAVPALAAFHALTGGADGFRR